MAARALLPVLAAAPLAWALATGCAGTVGSGSPPSAAPTAATPNAVAPSTSAASGPGSATPGDGSAAPGALAPVPTPTKTVALPPSSAFGQIHAGLEDATSEDCLGCHADAGPRIAVHGSHPVGLDLAQANASAPGRYRPLAQVRGAGLALPGGKVACLTCHDLASPWKHRIALPAGAVARRAVVIGDPSTYEEDEGGVTAAAAPGEAIATKPLCQSCHAF